MISQRSVDVLCFGGEDWWYHNRGHIDMQLMRRYAKKDVVLYVNSIVMQKLNLSQTRRFTQRMVRKARSIFTGLKKTDEGFWVYSPVSLPIQHITWAKWFNEALLRLQLLIVVKKIGMITPVVWVACPAACDIALSLKKTRLVYQRTDRFEDFLDVNAEVIKKYDRKLKTNADLTIYVNSALYQNEANQYKKAIYVDHSVDFEAFACAESKPSAPPDIKGIPKPIAGFIGSIQNGKPDIDFLGKVADLLPGVSFVLVGGAFIDCSRLASRKNVYMLGQKNMSLLPSTVSVLMLLF
jgi:hypothetical protein